MLDSKVISAILNSREAYDKVRDHLQRDELSPEAQMWYPLIKKWYATDRSSTCVDTRMLLEKGKRELPKEHVSNLTSWLEGLPPVESPKNIVEDMLELRRFILGNKLTQAITSRKHKDIPPLVEEYADILKATSLGKSEITWTMDDDEMDKVLDNQNKIKVSPKRLNEKLGGGIIRGDHLLIFGRPEAFKTGFTVNTVSGFLRQKLTVLYIGNEESTYKPRKRIINNLSGISGEEYETRRDEALALAREKGLDGLYMCRMYPGTLAEVEEVVKDIKPDVVVLDQIRGLDHPTPNGNFTQKLTQLGERFRNLAGKYDFAAISVTQAGDKTERHGQEPPEWLSMSDIDSNRTGLAGAVDVLIGIGTNSELDSYNKRAISICKNKNNDADDAKQGFYVEIDKRLSRVR